MKKKIFVSIIALAFMLISAVPSQAKASNSKILKNYASHLKKKTWDGSYYKYFALVDADKNGTPELLATDKMKGGKVKNSVSFISYYVNSGETSESNGAYGTTPYLYYNTKYKGILFLKDSYEYMNKTYGTGDDKCAGSNVKLIAKEGSKYTITEGHYSFEYGVKTSKVSKATMKKYRKTWAFTKSSPNTKKVKFIKVTTANLNKLKAGKIKVQR